MTNPRLTEAELDALDGYLVSRPEGTADAWVYSQTRRLVAQCPAQAPAPVPVERGAIAQTVAKAAFAWMQPHLKHIVSFNTFAEVIERALPSPGPAVEGWVLVPREPTDAMMKAACNSNPHPVIQYLTSEERGGWGIMPLAYYRAMLAASPNRKGPER